MDDKQSEHNDDRIAALEAEVKALRAQAIERDGELPSDAAAEAVVEELGPNRSRVIIIAVLLAALALAAMVALTSTLSAGFNIFAKKAASTMVPEAEEIEEKSQEPRTVTPAPASGEDLPRAPGL